MPDVTIVGSGPNGLAAAIQMAQSGYTVLLIEGAQTIGGGTRSAALTLPGFVHDVCSAIHPLGAGSPYLKTLPLSDHGLKWIHPPVPLAHPLDEESAVLLERAIDETAHSVAPDHDAYLKLLGPFVNHWKRLLDDILAPPHLPCHPLLLARFSMLALQSAEGLARRHFTGMRARALFAGLAAHSFLPLNRSPSAAFGLVLATAAHAVGWPMAEGGSQRITDAMANHLQSLGGKIVTGQFIERLEDLPPSRATLLDITPRQFLMMAPQAAEGIYGYFLKHYRYGPGVFKIDYALYSSIPWRDPNCLRAGTVHLGGSLEEIAASESTVWRGEHSERPFVILCQQSLFDPSRAPEGRHTAWAYCHAPNGSTMDMTAQIERQIERFAPGFRDIILARHTRTAVDSELDNPNLIGGDINGGVPSLSQMFARPIPTLNPYKTSIPHVYLCSASTPPGGGVHGMCGYHAACAALSDISDS